MGALTKVYAQSGNSCSTPISLGTLKDTTDSITFNYPDTVKWISFDTDSSLVSFLATSNKNSLGFIKIKELNIYNTACSIVSNNVAVNYPGELAQLIRRINLTINQTYLIKLVRYYDTSLNDTINREVLLNYRGGGSSGPCVEGLCNNLVLDGGYENNTNPLTNGTMLYDLNCWSYAIPGGGVPVYFNENYSDPLFQIPNQNIFNTSINLPSQVDPIFFPTTNEGYIGVETSANNSDIAQGYLSTSLQPSTLYFLTCPF